MPDVEARRETACSRAILTSRLGSHCCRNNGFGNLSTLPHRIVVHEPRPFSKERWIDPYVEPLQYSPQMPGEAEEEQFAKAEKVGVDS